ncbi:GxxExxY protein [Leeuwenhoekiella sp. CH_XMU1409-2]|uniref:GxxExxY protein n=1 Tax=Leeuwenhoekiella sp. CH_XMU1409-2 TaxID=3107768 RepID=UPI0030097707
MGKLIYEEESYAIIGACMQVHKSLGNGFLESVYQEALARELVNRNIPFLTKHKIEVFYEDQKLNKFFVADFVCFEHIVLELKATAILTESMIAQTINYLKATRMELGLLVNFGAKGLRWKRFINTNSMRD